MIRSVLICVCVILFVECVREPLPASPYARVTDPAVRFKIVDERGKAVISNNQLDSYDWLTHTITLMPGVNLRTLVGRDGGLIRGVPFSVIADGVACYSGVFTISISSIPQACPVIDVRPITQRPGTFAIQLGYPDEKFFRGKDPRGDERIRVVLSELGKLRE